MTDHQRLVMEILSTGDMLRLDRHNVAYVRGVYLQRITLVTLRKAGWIALLDKTRKASVIGNGYVITDIGRHALAAQASTSRTHSPPRTPPTAVAYSHGIRKGLLQISWLPGVARWSLTLDGEPMNGNYHSAQSAASQAHHEFDDVPDALAEWTPR